MAPPLPTGRDDDRSFYLESDITNKLGKTSIKDLPVGSRICINSKKSPNNYNSILYRQVNGEDATCSFVWKCLHRKRHENKNKLMQKVVVTFGNMCMVEVSGTTANTNFRTLKTYAQTHWGSTTVKINDLVASGKDSIGYFFGQKRNDTVAMPAIAIQPPTKKLKRIEEDLEMSDKVGMKSSPVAVD